MRTIGLIGGMSWESSIVYYQLINQKTKELLGGLHSSESVLYSVDFEEIARLQHENKWEELNLIMLNAAKRLENAGADFIVLCTNTMHLCYDAIRSGISIPFLHIAEATGEAIVKKGIKKIALLGTKFTMEKNFYKDYLKEKFNIETLIPAEEEREIIHNIIYNELVLGEINENSRQAYIKIINRMEEEGAQGVALACTEIPLLISNSDLNIPIFNTTEIHAEKAVEWSLKDFKY